MLYFVGFDVLPPFVAWAVSRSSSDQRHEYLRAYAAQLKNWQSTTPISFPTLDQYDETMQLKVIVAQGHGPAR
jgi:NAD(P)H dehydrogenase (quinone)